MIKSLKLRLIMKDNFNDSKEIKPLNEYELPLSLLYSLLFMVVIKVITVTVYRIGCSIVDLIKFCKRLSGFHSNSKFN